MGYRFSLLDVLQMVVSGDGDLHDGIGEDDYAFVGAHWNTGWTELKGDAEISLTSTEEDESERQTQRFKVTVERIL